MTFNIRPYHSSDLISLYRICLLTGDSGKDASHLYRDPDLLGHFYAAPYAVLEPDLCFILTANGAPCGYILGTRDSESFGARCEGAWFPPLREQYRLPDEGDTTPDARMMRLIHAGHKVQPDLRAYPAHLHIDLLPVGQGQGWGRRLMETFLETLKGLEVRAVHLGVSEKNEGAIRFYERVGFHEIARYSGWRALGMTLQVSC